ncbi:DUF309 domain-containing protein [Shimia abyssi]|uniref:DUF309 family protein family protein n=1 Tax=Shimia abyssi TaxID=1662395 RepID=A0A2P8FAF8_9RHOB|nr:DUF309 domain-containing protein [Shimia abyssi]PSL18699.1 hypothetical protein CLV88_10984 [Shimia abyssi]
MQAVTEWRPPYAYVPGQTDRHSEDLFDRFEFGLDAIETSDRWQLALAFMHEGFFWEAHELFEPIWMSLPNGSADRALVQGLIQLANAGLKQRMGRNNAVARLSDLAKDLLQTALTGQRKAIPGMTREDVCRLWEVMPIDDYAL